MHHEDPATGRLVVTLEVTGTFGRERFEEICRQPGVVSAELVYHYAEPDTGGDVGGVSDAGEC